MSFRHSFVVPSYNHGRYIGETIESLLAQDMPGSEIVVCDDGSTDDSRAVLERYRGRIRIVEAPRKLGMIPNYNFVTAAATGDWVSLVGSDDRAHPHFASTVRRGAERRGDVAVVSADFNHIDGAGRLIREERVLSVRAVALPPETFHTQLTAVKVHPVANAFRRDLWEKVGGFPEQCKLFGDWGFWLRMSPHGAFVHEPVGIVDYRIDYRPGIARTRMSDALRDDAYIMLSLIPEIARTLPGADMERVRRAQKRRLRGVIADASAELPPGERGFAVDILHDWAVRVGEEESLARFAAGERVSAGWPHSAVRRVLRDIYKIFK